MNDSKVSGEKSGLSNVRLALGSLPLMMGLAIAFFVARELLGFYQRLEPNPFIHAMEEHFRETTLFVFSGESLQVTEQGASILAFVLFFVLVIVAAHYSLRFIRAGIDVMTESPEVEKSARPEAWRASEF